MKKRSVLVVIGVVFFSTQQADGGATPPKCGKTPGDFAAVVTLLIETDEKCSCAVVLDPESYRACAAQIAAEAVANGTLPSQCAKKIRNASRRAICGYGGESIPCCEQDADGFNSCSVKSSPTECVAPEGGRAWLGATTSCYDACRKPCDSVEKSETQLQNAIEAASGGVEDPLGTGYPLFFDRLGAELRCDLWATPSEPDTSAVELMQTERALATADPTYCIEHFCEHVNYCSVGNSETNPCSKRGEYLHLPGKRCPVSVNRCLNKACFEHDLCYTRTCVENHNKCYFTVPQGDVQGCDQKFFEACPKCIEENRSLVNTNLTELAVCAYAGRRREKGPSNICTQLPCKREDKTCNPSTGICEACSVREISIESAYEGNLSSTDCEAPYRSNSFGDLYTFTGNEGDIIAVYAHGDLDVYLALIGPDGNLVADNNDCFVADPIGVENIDSCLADVALPVAGMYTLMVTSNEEGATGNYALYVFEGPVCTFSIAEVQRRNFGFTPVGECSIEFVGVGNWPGCDIIKGEAAVSSTPLFSFIGEPYFEVWAGDSWQIPVRFCPSTTGLVRGKVRLNTNKGKGIVRLRGNGITSRECLIEPSVSKVNFGSVRITECAETTITLSLPSGCPAIWTTALVEPGSEFYVLPGGFKTHPTPNRKELKAQYCPRVMGNARAEIFIKTSDNNRRSVVLKGKGLRL